MVRINLDTLKVGETMRNNNSEILEHIKDKIEKAMDYNYNNVDGGHNHEVNIQILDILDYLHRLLDSEDIASR